MQIANFMKAKENPAGNGGKKGHRQISDQWKKVDRFREELEQCYPRPPARRLKKLWGMIEDKHEQAWFENIEFSSPLEALIFCIRDGRYPPPEILLSLEESWYEYLQAAGSLTLDEALIGKPVRKGGNYAMQTYGRNQNLSLAILLLAIRREQEGISQSDAAVFAVNEYGLDIEPETLERKARLVTDQWVKRVSEWHSAAEAAAAAKLYLGKKRRNKGTINPGK